MLYIVYMYSRRDNPLQNGQLCINDAAGRCADGDIVGEDNELDIQDTTSPDAAYRDTGTILIIPVEPGLRAIWLIVDSDDVGWGGGAT